MRLYIYKFIKRQEKHVPCCFITPMIITQKAISHPTFILIFLFRVPIKMTTKAPTFTQPLQSVVALEGSAATFEAHISGKALNLIL